MSTDIDAVAFLESQHEEVNDLFKTLDKATAPSTKARILREIADRLVVHMTIEEKVFYPAVRARRTEEILLESLEEHLGIKRVLADLMVIAADDETFDAKAKVLREQVEHHVLEEEGDLFPKVERFIDGDSLIAIAQEMALVQDELLAANRSPLLADPSETDQAAALP